MKNSRFHRPAERLPYFTPGARFFVFLTAFATLQGCDKNPLGVIDPKGLPAFISSARVSPDSVKLTTLPESNGVLTVTLNARLQVSLPSGGATLGSVNAGVFATNAIDPFLNATLLDNGVAPDSTAGDGVYSARITFGVLKSATGRYRVQLSATTTDGLVSNILDLPFYMIRNNVAPALSNLSAPDTVTIPVGGGATIRMSVKATDGDGQSDIKEVFFRSLDSSDPMFKFLLLDDGAGTSGQSGDAVEGDSVYTVLISVADSPTVRKTYRFAFQAADAFGDTSATLLHRMTIR